MSAFDGSGSSNAPVLRSTTPTRADVLTHPHTVTALGLLESESLSGRW